VLKGLQLVPYHLLVVLRILLLGEEGPLLVELKLALLKGKKDRECKCTYNTYIPN
jgi:hypothetical protein